jgi:hypothetical protein
LFKAAIKAVMQRDPDAPQPRRRSGKKGGGGMIMQLIRASIPAARGRYAALQPRWANSMPAELLHAGSEWDAFDITSFAYEHGIDSAGEAVFDTKSDYLSPGL